LTLSIDYEKIQKNEVIMMEDDAFERLKEFMDNLPAGTVAQEMRGELIPLLMECWHRFSGSDEGSMAAYKLERLEYLYWDPPLITFIIERHGGMAMGSSRAELQGWEVNLNNRVAKYWKEGYRQIFPRNPPLDVKPIADELSRLIIAGERDDRLQWSTTGRVKILSGKIILSFQTPKQTIEGRRKRLIKALEKRLNPRGWKRHRAWWEKAN
jgi:hypothetical protein